MTILDLHHPSLQQKSETRVLMHIYLSIPYNQCISQEESKSRVLFLTGRIIHHSKRHSPYSADMDKTEV